MLAAIFFHQNQKYIGKDYLPMKMKTFLGREKQKNHRDIHTTHNQLNNMIYLSKWKTH